ncbi:hypothetical protein ABI59_06225 [Acidobacteria bacterium Mor1]|nr:hypothetical protein ABI59_06225 [Acidobacteria bacterium Mor1]
MTRRDSLATAMAWSLGAVIVIAPLPFGSIIPPARVALEVAALALACVWALREWVRGSDPLPRALLIGLLGVLLLGAFQMAPLPSGVHGALSPRSAELRTTTLAAEPLLAAESRVLEVEPEQLIRPSTLSVDPEATASALRTGTAYAALLLVALSVAAAGRGRLLLLAGLLSAAFQSLHGILVFLSGHDQIWNVAKRVSLDAATGTYINRNHFAGFVAAGCCCGAALALGLMRRRNPDAQHPLVRLLGADGSRVFMLWMLTALALAGLLLSSSRMGIAVGIGMLSITVLGSMRGGAQRRLLALAVLLLFAAIPLAQVGLEALFERYGQSFDSFAEGRSTVWFDTGRLATAFPLTGAGFGTFATVYPSFRSASVRLFYEHAHNDYLQFAAEGGLIGVLLIGLVLWVLVGHLRAALTGVKGTTGFGLAAALVTLLLHTAVDFHFHMPANGAFIAILAGALIGLPPKRRELQLVREEPVRPHRFRSPAVAALLITLALAATASGADRARQPVEAKDLVRSTILQAIEVGTEDQTVRDALLAMRQELARRPLQAKTRAIYAMLLFGAGRDDEALEAAAFHARLAAGQAPVTVPVVRYATNILVRTGYSDEGVELVGHMFGYAPRDAAKLLAQIETFVTPEAIESALSQRPEAWVARTRQLSGSGRRDEAMDTVRSAFQRWPEDLEVRIETATQALTEGDTPLLDRALSGDLPRVDRAARLWGYRAVRHAETGRTDDARRDAVAAVELDGSDPSILRLAGDARAGIGEHDEARTLWRRALHRLPDDGPAGARLAVLVRLARLEDRRGTGSAALSAWRSVLSLAPDNPEARRRVDELAGFRR